MLGCGSSVCVSTQLEASGSYMLKDYELYDRCYFGISRVSYFYLIVSWGIYFTFEEVERQLEYLYLASH